MRKSIHSVPVPILESWIARVGIIGLALLSGAIGVHFWVERGDMPSAGLTVAAECVALGGASLVVHHARKRWATALGAFLVTALAAGWCGLTMTEKLSSEAHSRAMAAAEASPAYMAAKKDHAVASAAYLATFTAAAPSESTFTSRIEALSADKARTRADAKAERDEAQARLNRLTPEPQLELLAILRGAGLELAKLLGLVVFTAGAGFTAKRGGTQRNAEWDGERDDGENVVPLPTGDALKEAVRAARAADVSFREIEKRFRVPKATAFRWCSNA